MSYDLRVSGLDAAPAPCRTKLDKLIRSSGCTALGDGDARTIALQLSDEALIRLYKALVQVAKQNGLELFDLQLGQAIDLRNPGRYPPMWQPSSPVHGKSLTTKVKALFQDHLGPLGFAPKSKWVAQRRRSACVYQSIWVTRGQGSRSGKLRVQAVLAYSFDGSAPVHGSSVLPVYGLSAVGAPHRPATGTTGEWRDVSSPAILDQSFETLRAQLSEVVFPLFEALSELPDIVRAYEAGTLDARYADHTGRTYHGTELAFGRTSPAKTMGQVYGHLGRKQAGAAHYLRYLSAIEAQGVTYRYQSAGLWPKRSEAEQRAEQDAAFARWLDGERKRATSIFA